MIRNAYAVCSIRFQKIVIALGKLACEAFSEMRYAAQSSRPMWRGDWFTALSPSPIRWMLRAM